MCPKKLWIRHWRRKLTSTTELNLFKENLYFKSQNYGSKLFFKVNSFIAIANGLFQTIGLFHRKNSNSAGRIGNFQGYQRNTIWNLQGLIKTEVEFPSKGEQVEIMWNFQGSLFLLAIGLGISIATNQQLTQFWGISRGWALFCLEFPGVK